MWRRRRVERDSCGGGVGRMSTGDAGEGRQLSRYESQCLLHASGVGRGGRSWEWEWHAGRRVQAQVLGSGFRFGA
jgi:hypothetical protein